MLEKTNKADYYIKVFHDGRYLMVHLQYFQMVFIASCVKLVSLDGVLGSCFLNKLDNLWLLIAL